MSWLVQAGGISLFSGEIKAGALGKENWNKGQEADLVQALAWPLSKKPFRQD